MSVNRHRPFSALLRGVAAIALVPILTAAQTAVPPPIEPPPGQPPLSLADATAIQAVLQGAPAQGIATPNVAPDVAELASNDPAARAGAQDRLAHAAIAYARAERGMDLDPQSVDDDFALRAPFDAAAEFAQARDSGQVGAWLAAQTRRDPAYLALVAARARYQAIDAHGGWGTIAGGRAIGAGMRDRRVPTLRQRLAAEGYDAKTPVGAAVADLRASDAGTFVATAAHAGLPHPRRTHVKPTHTVVADVFDPALSRALADFQDHHGLKPDGVLTPETVAALDVSAHDRLAALDANLERARWLPVAMPPTRIEVDSAGPEVALFQDGRPTLAMLAVAGEEKRPTPMFASEITAVEFNPPWIVPNDIARKEIYPKGRGYMARNDFHVVDGRLVQHAGPKSSLGYVKFEIPDRFSVYLHDTPARSLFTLAKRWKSHGCVRLAAPRQLAALLLGWDATAVDQAIAAGATKTYALKTRIPVYVVYRTAWVAHDGHASFRSDVYGWDDELADALAGAPEPKQTHEEAGV